MKVGSIIKDNGSMISNQSRKLELQNVNKPERCLKLKAFRDRLKERTDKTLDDLKGHISVSKAVLILILNLLLPGLGTMVSVNFVTSAKILEMQKNSDAPKVTTSFIFHLD